MPQAIGAITSISGIERAEGLAANGHDPSGGLHVRDKQMRAISVHSMVANRREQFHPGLVIVVPSVTPARQRYLFRAVLFHIGGRDLTNAVVE